MKRSFLGYLLSITFLCIFFSCSNKSQQTKSVLKDNSQFQDSIYHIHLSQKGNGKCPISLIAKNIEYIPLETNKKSFFHPEIVKYRFKDSLIVLSDGDKILVFNRNGKFIRRIGKTGKGPGEHLRIHGFDINGDTLYCSSSGTRKIIKYTLEGKYIGETNLKSQAAYFRSLGDKGFGWYDRHKGSIIYFDRMWNSTDTLKVEYNVSPKRYRWVMGVPDCYYLYQRNNRLLFNNYRNDTIWDVTDKKRKPAIIFDLKERIMPESSTIWSMDGNEKKYRENWVKYDRVHPVMGDSLVVVVHYNYSYEKQLLHVYNKNRKQTQCFETDHIIDDVHGDFEICAYPIQSNKIINFLSYEDIKEEYDGAESEEAKAFLKGLLDKVKNINGNPVMVIIEIK